MSSAALRKVVLLLCLPVVAACGGPSGETRPNVILITIDTLRQDHLSSYGYARRTTPFLDSLASDGVRFTRAYSTSSWTVPAVASLMTSLHPQSHGVVSGAVSDGAIYGQQILPAELTRLPELLQGAGYTTFGITANAHLSPELGYAVGFDRYENLGFGAQADELNRTLATWKDEIGASAPYFLWLHYFDPHAPYLPRAPWLAEYAPEGVENPRRLLGKHGARHLRKQVGKNTPAFHYLMALYDSEIGFTDNAIREALEMLGIGSDTLIAVTADHGEEFLDHGNFGHEGSLFEELIKVPLIVRFPDGGYAGRVVEDSASLIDIGPGLLDYLGIEVPGRFQGESFMGLLEDPDRRRQQSRAILSTISRHGWPGARAIVQGDWKYVRYVQPYDQEILFRLDTDPAERVNLARSSRLKAAMLDDVLTEKLDAYSTGVEPEVYAATEETLEELRSLGYVQ